MTFDQLDGERKKRGCMSIGDDDFEHLYTAYQSNAAHEQTMRATLLSFLEILDSVDRCLAAPEPKAGSDTRASSWRSNFEGVQQQLLQVFERAGVTFMNCVGQPFDPQMHDALERRFDPEAEENLIVEEVARGCLWQGEVLRYAKVIVATPRPHPSTSSQGRRQVEACNEERCQHGQINWD